MATHSLGHEPHATEPPSAWAGLFADVLRALDHAGVRHCVLRRADADAGRALRREVDMLVDPRDLVAFGRAVAVLGFVPLAAWGHGGHRFYTAFEETAGEWLKLDVVTGPRYGGRNRPLSCAALAACLERRRRADEAWVPDVVDALLGLILHGTLDKRGFREERRNEIVGLRSVVEADAALKKVAVERFAAALGPALPWPEASAAIAERNWGRLLDRRRRIEWRLFWREPLGCAGRWVAGELARVARSLLVATRRRGFTIALLGTDEVKKTSVARALADDAQIRARMAELSAACGPRRVVRPGRPRDERLPRSTESGGNGGPDGIGDSRLAGLGLRLLIAFAWELRGRFVIYDRHPGELRGGEPGDGAGSRFRRWLLRIVSRRPDLILVLDVPNDQTPGRPAPKSDRDRWRPLAGPDCLVLESSLPADQTVRRAKSALWNRYLQCVKGSTS